ncbi:unnamed protein product [Ascophyllum nodosum]
MPSSIAMLPRTVSFIVYFLLQFQDTNALAHCFSRKQLASFLTSRNISCRRSDRSRRCFPSLWMATTPNPAWNACVVNDDRTFRRYQDEEPLFSPQGFLLAFPPGPYTCLRTAKNRSAAMLSFHLKRLWESAEATGLGDVARHEGRHSLEKRTVDVVTRAMEAFLAANAAMDHACPECMVTVLYVHQDHDLEVEHLENRYPENGHQEKEGMRSIGGPQPLKILAHAWPLSPTKPGPERSELEVLVVDSRRFRPEAKHSSWLRERRHLDAAKINAGSNEAALSEIQISREGIARRVLLEGLTSNIFVVEEDGTLYTAPSGVLLGGMRQLCIEICTKEGFPVKMEPPDMSRAGRWHAAFLTGSGRILAPISAFLMAEDADNEILTSQSEHASTVVRLKPPMVREQIDVDNDSGGSRKCRESSASPLPLRFEVGASDEITSLVQRLRSYMVAELESSATRLL